MAPLHSAVEARDVSIVATRAFGYEGIGILVVSGVPELSAKRGDLLPLAFAFANLPDNIKPKFELPEAFYNFG
ncbi:hypothetical protein PF010_g4223 [Phytophthora fragariae]|uniref:Uncharacterized protein n=1 Tax=Phytophthora fragariae TaxID=53985 RepID=A0A6G0LSS3_9STRA|nr:hypothetical protein PF010_g4223 [Phytophthora fragariae]